MLKKRVCVLFMVLLSFFVLGGCGNASAAKNNKTDATVEGPSLKMYMPMAPLEVEGKKLSATGGSLDEAARLFDKDTSTDVGVRKDTTVTIDMGEEILLTQIVYHTAAIDKENGTNCLGTRFFASNDNKNYIELAVIEDSVPPEKESREIDFSGFGKYRYLRVSIPGGSNISEVEWMTTECFVTEMQGDGGETVTVSISAYDALRDIDATILGVLYNEKGVMKKVNALPKKFLKGEETDFSISMNGMSVDGGDFLRIAVFDGNGSSPISSPLTYCVNGAARSLTVSSFIGDNMILQAEKNAVISGRAPRGATVTVELESALGGGISRQAVADSNGNWKAELGSFSCGGDYTLTVKQGGSLIKYKNITFGDVWLCTGQSNMDYYMMGGDDTAAELEKKADIENENIRILNFWDKGIDGAAKPVDNPPSDGVAWHTASADTISYCSAVGYYFARELQETTDRPIGIINVAVGDTEINRWIAQGQKYGRFTSTSGNLYNNRIYPLSSLSLKGIILYQGEADQYRTHMSSAQYSDAMAGLADSYRKIWGSDLPFYWAQLARYKVDESDVREGQRLALSKVSVKKNVGMIVLNDIVGNYNGGSGSCRDDIHPWDKKTVAERFARYALRDCYGEDVAVSGPKFKSAKREGNKMVVTFDCSGELTVMPSSQYADKITDEKIKSERIDVTKPYEFEVAGSDKVFKPADAKLEGKTVVLTSDEVKTPVYVRYAWGAYPEMPNLTDDSGLPTETFTTEK